MHEPTADFLEILRILSNHKVDFIVVGGVCAVLHGAPLATFDIDVVHSRDSDNIERLLSALEELKAYYRDSPGRHLHPQLSHLASPGHQLLLTRFGPLDILGTIGSGLSYRDLTADTVAVRLDDMEVRMLTLESLIAAKRATGRDKDKAVLALLDQTLKEKQRK
jgi:predicted nucleotidyltransferase